MANASLAQQIFEGDPNRPGAGYVNFQGKSYRIEGTTHAGQAGDPTASDQYILDAGGGNTLLGPNINVSDYLSWINSPHAANAPGVGLPGQPAAPTASNIDETTNQLTLTDSGSSSSGSGSSSSGSSGSSGGRGLLSPSGPLDTNPATQEPIPVQQTDSGSIIIPGLVTPPATQTNTTGGTGSSGGTNTGNTTPGTSGTTGTPGSTDQSLLTLLAALYGGGGGGNNADTGLGGLLAGPVNTATGADAGVDSAAPAQATGMSSHAKILILLVVGGLAFWWWRKHHKKGGPK